MDIAGLPLHPLIVHAAVVFAPLAALVTAVFVLVPRWRWLTRWPTVVSAAVALVSVLAARFSGDYFLEQRPELAQLVRVHQERGELLMWFMIGFFVLVAFAGWALRSSTPLPSGRGGRDTRLAPVLEKVLPAVVTLTAVVVLVQVILTGDAGSRAVWGG